MSLYQRHTFPLIKRERIRRNTYATREEAKQDVFDYIEMFYNPERRHSFSNVAGRVRKAVFSAAIECLENSWRFNLHQSRFLHYSKRSLSRGIAY